jgi:hypothetical protein
LLVLQLDTEKDPQYRLCALVFGPDREGAVEKLVADAVFGLFEQGDGQLLLAIDHVVVGDHIAVGMNDESGAQPDRGLHLDHRLGAATRVLGDGQLAPLRIAAVQGTGGCDRRWLSSLADDTLDSVRRDREHRETQVDHEPVGPALNLLADDPSTALELHL